MNVHKQIHAAHPLFQELRNGWLWHCTSAGALRQIWVDGCLRPVAGTLNRWGNRPYACQALGAICLFDFTTESESRVLATADRWQQFLGAEAPATIVLGMDSSNLPGRLVRYPENSDSTPPDSCGPIPWVEVCHVGEIPVTAVVSYLLICQSDYSRFKRCAHLDDLTLASIESEFGEVVRRDEAARAGKAEQIRAGLESPEFKARLIGAKRRVEEMRDRI